MEVELVVFARGGEGFEVAGEDLGFEVGGEVALAGLGHAVVGDHVFWAGGGEPFFGAEEGDCVDGFWWGVSGLLIWLRG